jgi:hypothetical protein
MTRPPYCDWCEQPLEEAVPVEWHGSVGHHRCIVRAAVEVWATRHIEGERPPPIDDRPVPALNAKGLCAYCCGRLGSLPERRLGALACRECADRWAVLDGAPERQPDPLIPFLRRLGREAARLNLDTRKLAQAVRGARCA